jgi:hypothetical protein
MEGPSATIALVLAEAAVGGTALLWLGGLWGAVKRGLFILTGASVLALGLLSTLAAVSSAEGPGALPSAEKLVLFAASAFAILLGLSLSALILRIDLAGRVLGWLAIPAGLALLFFLAQVADEGSVSFITALVQILAGAVFLGAVTDGLLLGHWYLTDRRLPREHIRRFATYLLVAVILEAIALLVLGLGDGPADPGGFSVILGVSGLTTWVALGMVGCTGLIAFLIRASLRGESSRAVQGATGFFYLAVITAFTAEMAAKVGFLG